VRHLPHIYAQLFNELLLGEPRKVAAIALAVTGGGIVIDGVEPSEHVAFANGRPSMGRLGDPLGRAFEGAGRGKEILDMDGNVAVIAMEGSLVNKGAYIGAYSGATSYEGLTTQFNRAMRDPAVKGVVLEADSFGGQVAGAFETAEGFFQLSAAKPTLAILTDHALSAGYLIASAARAVVMPEMGSAGSIGCVMLHLDFSRQLANEGIAVTVLSSGAHKTAGNPFAPLPPEVAAGMRAQLDRGRDLFAEAVGRYRGKRLTKQKALATEAAVLLGREAVANGLTDGVLSPAEAYAEFVSKINRGRS
jgi:ClpP class serine protease